MDRESFFYLFVHANSLAELGLQRALEDSLPSAPAVDSEPTSDPDLVGAFDNLDFDALDGLDDLVNEALEVDASPAPTPSSGCIDSDTPFDPGAYLANAYSARETLESRTEAARLRIDSAALESRLAALPPGPRLTARLTGPEFANCLALYRSQDEALHALVAEVRRVTA